MGRNSKGSSGARRGKQFRRATNTAVSSIRNSGETPRRLFDSLVRSHGERRAGTIARLATGFIRSGMHPTAALAQAAQLTDRRGMREHRGAWQGAEQLGRSVRRNLANEIIAARRSR